MVQIALGNDVLFYSYVENTKKGTGAFEPCPANKLKDKSVYYMVTPDHQMISKGEYRVYTPTELENLRKIDQPFHGMEFPSLTEVAEKDFKKKTEKLFIKTHEFCSLDKINQDWQAVSEVVTFAKTDSASALSISYPKPSAEAKSEDEAPKPKKLGQSYFKTPEHNTKPNMEPDSLFRKGLGSFLDRLRTDREDKVLLNVKNNPDLFSQFFPDQPDRHKKYVDLYNKHKAWWRTQKTKAKARDFLLLEVALLQSQMNPKPERNVNKIFQEGLAEYIEKRSRTLDKNGAQREHLGWFASHSFSAWLARKNPCGAGASVERKIAKNPGSNSIFYDERSLKSKVDGVATVQHSLERGEFDFDKLPPSATNGRFEETVKFFKARYAQGDINQRPQPVVVEPADANPEGNLTETVPTPV